MNSPVSDVDLHDANQANPKPDIEHFHEDSKYFEPAWMRTTWFKLGYPPIAYCGLLMLSANLISGFRFSPTASAWNYLVNLLLYGAYMGLHLVMTTEWFKDRYWKASHGTPAERRVYILGAAFGWLAIFLFHQPVPGFSVPMPEIVRFFALTGFLLCFLIEFGGGDRAVVEGMIALPGAKTSFSHGPTTPLLQEGAYSEIRHPMYRSTFLMCTTAFVMHSNAAQLFWSVLIVGTLFGFIPFEETRLIEARGDEYRDYMKRVPYRIWKGIW